MFNIFGGNLIILDWYGFKNPNSCLINYSNDNINIVLFPFNVFKNIYYFNSKFTYEIGLGFIAIIIDIRQH